MEGMEHGNFFEKYIGLVFWGEDEHGHLPFI
jgi:hypothetical protein